MDACFLHSEYMVQNMTKQMMPLAALLLEGATGAAVLPQQYIIVRVYDGKQLSSQPF